MSEYTDDIEFKEIERQKKIRKKKNYLVRILVVFVFLAAVALFLSSSFFDIQNIEVEGNKYYTDGEVINLADATLGVNLFWGAGDSQIKANLGKNPYFSDVKVKRKLPSTLIIELKERAQIAAIVYGDKYVVIDKEGTVLRKSEVDPKVTLLTGLTISKLNVKTSEHIKKAQALKVCVFFVFDRYSTLFIQFLNSSIRTCSSASVKTAEFSLSSMLCDFMNFAPL